MAAQQTNSIYREAASKDNGSIDIKKPGTMNYQWRPTTRNGVDRLSETNLEHTLVATPQISYKAATLNLLPPLHPNSLKKISQNGSVHLKANMKYLSNSKTTMQQEKVAPVTLSNSDNVRNLPPAGVGAGTAADHIGKLAEQMQTTTISAKSKTTDDSDKIWLPQMDGIDVVLPSSSLTTNQSSSSAAKSTTDHKVKMTDEMLKTEEYINSVLYGPRKTKRLPVFEEICPSSLFSDTDTEKPH